MLKDQILPHQSLLRIISTGQSWLRVAPVSCFNSAWVDPALSSHPHGLHRSGPPSFLVAPSDAPRPPPLTQKIVSPSQLRQNYHRDVEAAINHQIYAFYIYLSVTYYFDRDDVALKNLAKYVLQQSHEKKEHAEKLMTLQNQRGGGISLQDIKKPDYDNRENQMNAMECASHLGKSVTQSLLELHKLATDKNDPHLCDFIETHYLNEQAKPTKELGGHVTSLYRVGAPESGRTEYLFDKYTVGDRDES
ncbi:ferritin heavy chain-like [Myotis daubentonii]|uniref:ferritin heavy chain-like n=1 Tax=Myotis daubentonii TaxID=98922 RepID=UPI0028735527|nr:ferritin heavy chain-like [Myotis daubentonii]